MLDCPGQHWADLSDLVVLRTGGLECISLLDDPRPLARSQVAEPQVVRVGWQGPSVPSALPCPREKVERPHPRPARRLLTPLLLCPLSGPQKVNLTRKSSPWCPV